MAETWLIRHSRQASLGLWSVAAAGCCIAFASVEPWWLSALVATLIGLLARSQQQDWQVTHELWLNVDSKRKIIALGQGEQTHFFDKYKVYPSRWFAILKLIEPRQTRVLFLFPDRFKSPQDYRDCRLHLQQLERDHVA